MQENELHVCYEYSPEHGSTSFQVSNEYGGREGGVVVHRLTVDHFRVELSLKAAGVEEGLEVLSCVERSREVSLLLDPSHRAGRGGGEG